MVGESPQSQSDNQHVESLQEILAEDQLQADEVEDDGDSAYNDSTGSASYMTSLSSSVVNYKYENGRRYHAYREGEYIMPNDEEEQDRMDLVHHIYRLHLRGELFLAPISKNPQRVLDIGTGTGIWAIDFAEEYPSAKVIGTDLSPIQPKWVPPNCLFELDDYEAERLYKKPFDFIHARELEGCIKDDDLLFRRVLDNLTPGGWFEIQCAYGRICSDDETIRKAVNNDLLIKIFSDGFSKFGKPFDLANTWKEKLIKTGFVDVQQEVRKNPIGTWPKDPHMKEIGKYQFAQHFQAVDSYTPGLLSRIMGWSPEEIEVFKAKVKNELKDSSIHIYIPLYFLWGRKPTA